MNRSTYIRKRLLVASVGVATVVYATQVAGCEEVTSGNLMSPPPQGMDAGSTPPPEDADVPPSMDAQVDDDDASTDAALGEAE